MSAHFRSTADMIRPIRNALGPKPIWAHTMCFTAAFAKEKEFGGRGKLVQWVEAAFISGRSEPETIRRRLFRLSSKSRSKWERWSPAMRLALAARGDRHTGLAKSDRLPLGAACPWRRPHFPFEAFAIPTSIYW